jgi:RNA polymerase sigma-70 factor, ECF subfamily
MTMPLEPGEYRGHTAIRHFLANAFAGNRDHPHRLIATRANAQPAFAHYAKDPRADIGRARSVFVLTLDGNQISHNTRFPAPGALPHFGLPRTTSW